MSILFIEYPKCTTCIKAKKFLIENNVDFQDRHIVDNNPTKEELALWIDKSGLEIKKFFNTSGKLYKEMNLKDKIKDMSKEDCIELLSANGMLVKRPLLIEGDKVLVGFKEENYREFLNKAHENK
jgi:arsenate reductase